MSKMLTAEHKAELRKWLPGKDFRLIYKATRDGCTGQSFHNHCNNKGPTLSVGINSTGYVFGGYASQPWTSVGNYKQDAGAFLFRLCQQNGTSNPKQYNVTNVAYSMYDNASYGPTFGGHDLLFFNGNITFDAANGYLPTNGSSTFGNSFNTGGDDKNTFCGSDFKFQEIEVYDVIENKLLEADETWRKTAGWTPEVKDSLMSFVAKYEPISDINVPQARILLVGSVGAGKSSFFNTVNSAFRGHVTNQALSGGAGHSLTTKYRAYAVRSGREGTYHNYRLCDTMGIEEDQGLDMADMPYILDGNVSDGYKFNPLANASPSDACFNKDPPFSDKVHCVAFVVDATTVGVAPPKTVEKMMAVKKMLLSRGIPHVVLLTKIDKVCEHIAKDPANTYRSKEISEIAQRASDLLKVPLYCILPVMNYEKEIELETSVDILVLTAMKQMLRFTDNFYEDYCHVQQEKRGNTLKSKCSDDKAMNNL